MELKHELEDVIMRWAPVLIVPSGIETKKSNISQPQKLSVLIVPSGIETIRSKSLCSNSDSVLIVPSGIETS